MRNHPYLVQTLFCQAKPGANLSRFAVLGHSWRAMTIRAEVCVYVKKDLPQNRPESEKKMTGSELDPHADEPGHLENRQRENTTKVMLG